MGEVRGLLLVAAERQLLVEVWKGVCSGVVVDKVLKILQNVLHPKAWQHESFQTPRTLQDLQPDLVFNFK